MKCMCGGDCETQYRDELIRIGKKVVTVRNVPLDVCTRCNDPDYGVWWDYNTVKVSRNDARYAIANGLPEVEYGVSKDGDDINAE